MASGRGGDWSLCHPGAEDNSAIETKLIWLKNNVAAGKLECAVSSPWGRGEGLRHKSWCPDDLGAKGPVVRKDLGA